MASYDKEYKFFAMDIFAYTVKSDSEAIHSMIRVMMQVELTVLAINVVQTYLFRIKVFLQYSMSTFGIWYDTIDNCDLTVIVMSSEKVILPHWLKLSNIKSLIARIMFTA